MGTDLEVAEPAGAWRRTLLRAQLIHADEAELEWLIADTGTREGVRYRRALTTTMVLPMAINSILIWARIGGVLAAGLVVGLVVIVGLLALVFQRPVDLGHWQAQFRTLKRSPTPEDPTVPADGLKRRRVVRLTRGALLLSVLLLPMQIAVLMIDDDEPPRDPGLYGFDSIQVGGVMCLLDTSSLLNLSAIVINNTDDDYVITLRADVRTADNAYESEQDLLVPAHSSNTRFSTFTGLTAPAERCQLTQVDQRRVEP